MVLSDRHRVEAKDSLRAKMGCLHALLTEQVCGRQLLEWKHQFSLQPWVKRN